MEKIKYKINYSDIKTKLSQRRYKHVEGVVKKAIEINNIYDLNLNLEKLNYISWYHDYFKELTAEEIINISNEIKFKYEEYESLILHGFLLADYLKYYNYDTEICSAIKFHSTLTPNPTNYEMVIYVSDYIEDGREGDHYEKIRELINEVSLIKLCYKISLNICEFLKRINQTINENTLNFINWYEEKYDSNN